MAEEPDKPVHMNQKSRTLSISEITKMKFAAPVVKEEKEKEEEEEFWVGEKEIEEDLSEPNQPTLGIAPGEKTHDGLRTYQVFQDNAPDLQFDGKILGVVSSRTPSAKIDRWTELYLYRTRAKKYVCIELGLSTVLNERPRCKTAVCTTHNGVIEFFGQGWLAKQLYRKAGISNIVIID